MKKISLPNLVVNDAERARKVATVNVHVSDAKMLVLVPINMSVRMRVMVAKAATDVTWEYPSRRTIPQWRPVFCHLPRWLVDKEVLIRARSESADKNLKKRE